MDFRVQKGCMRFRAQFLWWLKGFKDLGFRVCAGDVQIRVWDLRFQGFGLRNWDVGARPQILR